MGPTALHPLRRGESKAFLRRKACWGSFRPKNPTASAGCEPANLGTKGQHATSRPPNSLYTPRLKRHLFITTKNIQSLSWSYNQVRLYLGKPRINVTLCTINITRTVLDWNRASALRGRQVTVWAMTQPNAAANVATALSQTCSWYCFRINTIS
jgi:hypothetical protein